MKKLEIILMCLLACVCILPCSQAIAEDDIQDNYHIKEAGLTQSAALLGNKIKNIRTASSKKEELESKKLGYAPGQLIVKLKEGSSLDTLAELNAKYNVTSAEKVFKDIPKPEDSLKELKDKLSSLGIEHDKWYWQTDKDSEEYKQYIEKIEKEKEELTKQIQVQEGLIEHLEQRQKRAPEGAAPPNLETIYSLKTGPKTDIGSMASEYQTNPNVEYAEPNYVARAQMVPNDPLYKLQWAHQNTQAELGWDITTGSPDTIIAIIDTGVDYNHEDLSVNIWRDAQGNPGKDFVDIDTQDYINDGYELIPEEDYTEIDNDPMDYDAHGTHVAGIAGAVGNNGIGISGACSNCKIMPVRSGFAIDYEGETYGSLEYDDIVNAIRYAADNGADVINMSFGGEASQTEKDVLDYAYSKGLVLIAAAGNEYTDAKSYPAAFENVIAVSATKNDDVRVDFSNYGYWVDVAAPGYRIVSTIPKQSALGTSSTGYRYMYGTSMASPYIAGSAGIILSKNPEFKNEEVKRILKQAVDNALPISNEYFGTGRINIKKALEIDTPSAAVAKITSPESESFLSETFMIDGTATGQNYVIDYGEGRYPAQWNPIETGNSVIAGCLGTFDIGNMPDGEYTIRLTVNDNNAVHQDYVAVYLMKDLQAGWQTELHRKLDISSSSPVIADLDKDGALEIIVATGDGRLYVFKNNGAIFSDNWPQKPIAEADILLTPAIGDLIGDDNNEIVVMAKGSRKLSAYSVDGTLLAQKYIDETNSSSANWISPVLEDISADGKDEIMLLRGNLSQGSNLDARLFVLDGNLNTLEGWPKVLAGQIASFEPAVADLDNDNKFELITISVKADGSESILETWNSNGNLIWSRMVPYWSQAAPIAVDLNLDGYKEVVFGATDEGMVHIFTHLGSDYADCPQIKLDGNYKIIAAKMDADNYPDLIVSSWSNPDRYGLTDKITIFNHKGNVIGEITTDEAVSVVDQPIAADIDSDGAPEVIFNGAQTKKVYAFKLNGSIVPGFPKYLFSSLFPYATPTVADLDNDGDIELISGGSGLCVYDLKGVYKDSAVEWPMFQHDPQHTGTYSGFDAERPTIIGLVYPVEYLWNTKAIFGLIIKAFDPKSSIVGYRYKLIEQSTPPKVIKEWASDENTIPSEIGHSGGETSIDFSIEGLELEHAKTYYISAQVRNAAGVWSEPDEKTVLTVDTTLPSIPDITVDKTTTSTSTLNASWVSSDSESGISQYHYDIRQDSPEGAQLTHGMYMPDKDGLCKVSETGLKLIPGKAYYFVVTAVNGAYLVSEAHSEPITVKALDTTPPTGSIKIGDNAEYATSNVITLNLSASDAESGIDKMQFSNDGTAYSNPEPYVDRKSWLMAGGTGGKRTVYAKFSDTAGNWSQAYSDDIILDFTPPTITKITLEKNYVSSLSALSVSWLANDPESGIKKYNYSITRDAPYKFFSPTVVDPNIYVKLWDIVGTATSIVLPDVSHSSGYLSADLSSGRTYYFNLRAENNAGVGKIISSESIILDSITPTGSVKINNGAGYTANASITLNLSATDKESGIDKIQLSNDGVNYSQAEPYAATKPWTLTAGGSKKTVYVKFSDTAGNWSQAYSDDIIVDTVKPQLMNMTSGLQLVNQSLLFRLRAQDRLSGIDSVKVEVTSGAVKGNYACVYDQRNRLYATRLPAQSSPAIIFYRLIVKDKAGNETISGIYTLKVGSQLPRYR